MSNAAVGPVYDTIISEVINAVRVDFEENGVGEGVLEDLKKKWQAKLSQMKVAQFPWDPKPEPQATAAPSSNGPAAAPVPPPSVAPTASYTQSTLSPQGSAQGLSLPGALLPNANGVALKQESGLANGDPAVKQEPGLPSMPPMQPGFNPAGAGRGSAAAQRAAQALESQYGQRAAASINAIHSGMASQMNAAAQPQQQQPQGVRPGQLPPQAGQMPQHMTAQQQQQYRQGLAAAMQQRMQHQQQHQAPHAGPNGLPAAQHDGPSDDAAAAGPSRVQVDEHLHAQIAARARQMEGGGLMLPLREATKKTRGLAAEKREEGDGVPAQFDGPDDDIKSEEEDEDAINSDLDDSDDDKEDEEDDDETMGHMMLCMYDKVQRVKNKWKCILKDGVLTVNGKEYVFHKATGEYEW